MLRDWNEVRLAEVVQPKWTLNSELARLLALIRRYTTEILCVGPCVASGLAKRAERSRHPHVPPTLYAGR